MVVHGGQLGLHVPGCDLHERSCQLQDLLGHPATLEQGGRLAGSGGVALQVVGDDGVVLHAQGQEHDGSDPAGPVLSGRAVPDQRPPLLVGDHVQDPAKHRHPDRVGDHGPGAIGGQRRCAAIGPGRPDGDGVALREQRPDAGALSRIVRDGDRDLVDAVSRPVGSVRGEVMVSAKVHHRPDAQGDEPSQISIGGPGQVPGAPQEAVCGGATVGGR